MLRLLARRLALIVPTFIGVTLLGFLLIHSIPGDPVEVRVGERGITLSGGQNQRTAAAPS